MKDIKKLYEQYGSELKSYKDFHDEMYEICEYILQLRKEKNNYSTTSMNLYDLKDEISEKYNVSQNGKVFSKRRGRYLKMRPTPAGYIQCTISLNHNSNLSMYVHRLVALFHVKNPSKLDSVNHIDGNRGNNKSDNLEWVSHKQNHIRRSQRNSNGTFGANFCPRQKKWKAVIQINGGSYHKEVEANNKYNEMHKIIYGYNVFEDDENQTKLHGN
ncbi:hypothetical protein BALOs_1565 [Halobacteriovorax sp. BALOs_7]|uniref:HNH endonuclease n=1 Tax=Halobacteriovorax vibrionivorans TaxID=2152716 RepID=A0ABY0ICD0_9BACT|nr:MULTISPECIES: HNH endonuclease [Halobacteriovorax]AYF44566.1 hypothetical protein BALOs_1565 [Halobacteriovorax sp. BALOs_7]RZF20618.1 HNH endonuclease [Halobacteriovorax vibrionivorans]TGD47532.1 HNH endonuclease [Halobacteriovorax sp. Y22]